MNPYTDNFNYKFINDPIYGGIGLSKFEVDLINTRAFQRLRHLRQLALVNYVFPGAEHSRFVHSLGVLYIMGRMTDHLLSNRCITPSDQIKLRTAALLHDIGHYPFSHLGEDVYKYKEEPTLLKGFKPKDSLLSRLSPKSKNKRAHHEKLGQYIINNSNEISPLIKNIDLDPEEIGDIITGEIGTRNLVFSQLMHSSLDADRLDFLLRDSFQTGVQYGRVDLDYIIRLLKVVPMDIEQDGNIEKTNVIAANIKGQHVVEHYLMSRYFHYSQVIGHKTSLAFESLAKVVFYKLIEAEQFIFNSYNDIITNINDESFLRFTDEELVKDLNNYYSETTDTDFKIFYDQIRYRRRPKTLIELKDIKPKTNALPVDQRYYNLKRLLTREPDKLSQMLDLPNEFIGYQEFQVSVESIPSYVTTEALKTAGSIEEGLREAVRLVNDENEISYLALDNKSLIHSLTDMVSSTIRVFYIEPEESPVVEVYGEKATKYFNDNGAQEQNPVLISNEQRWYTAHTLLVRETEP